jgi:hypothetical protein
LSVHCEHCEHCSHLVNIVSGGSQILSDILISSPIIMEEGAAAGQSSYVPTAPYTGVLNIYMPVWLHAAAAALRHIVR